MSLGNGRQIYALRIVDALGNPQVNVPITLFPAGVDTTQLSNALGAGQTDSQGYWTTPDIEPAALYEITCTSGAVRSATVFASVDPSKVLLVAPFDAGRCGGYPGMSLIAPAWAFVTVSGNNFTNSGGGIGFSGLTASDNGQNSIAYAYDPTDGSLTFTPPSDLLSSYPKFLITMFLEYFANPQPPTAWEEPGIALTLTDALGNAPPLVSTETGTIPLVPASVFNGLVGAQTASAWLWFSSAADAAAFYDFNINGVQDPNPDLIPGGDATVGFNVFMKIEPTY